MELTKINNKWELLLPEHRAARSEWPTWEYKRLESMHQHLTSQDTLFYVGAEEGDMPALCSSWNIKEILLFEPNPRVWSNIKAIFTHNNLPTPLCYVGFASDRTTQKTVRTSFPPEADGPLISDHGFLELRDRNAPEVKIDDIPLIPTALSIDVEGSEWQVLRGAQQTLKTHHPKIWLSLHPEFMYEHYKEYAFDLRHWIKSFDYTETLLDYQHEVHLFYE